MPKTIKLTKAQFHAVVGFLTIIIGSRRKTDELSIDLANLLKEYGAQDDGKFHSVEDEVNEAVFNEGDNAGEAAKVLLKRLNVEVENA